MGGPSTKEETMRRLALTVGAAAFLTLSTPAIATAAPDARVETKAPAKTATKAAEPAAKAPAKTDAPKVDATPKPPEDVKGAVSQAKDAVAAAKAGNWWYFSALVITVLLFLLKFIGIRAGFWPKMGRWRYILSPVLSLAAALLAAFQGGVSFDVALGVFTSSYATSSLQELWEHGILGKPRASASSG
jgi:hypothetical protein